MKRKKVVCIVEGYYSLTEANAICLSNIAQYWNREGFLFDVVSIEKEKFADKDGIIQCVIPQKMKYKLVREIRKFVNLPVGRPFLVKLLFEILVDLMKIFQYDGLIAVVNPIESAVAAVEIKKRYPGLFTVLYEIDPSSNRYKNPSNLFEKWWKIKSTNWELSIYRNFDRIIHMTTHRKDFSSQQYNEFSQKTLYLDIPAFSPHAPDLIKHKDNKEVVRLLYAGAFYPKLRNPMRMIELLKK